MSTPGTGGRAAARRAGTALRAAAGPARRQARTAVDAALPALTGLFLASLVEADPNPSASWLQLLGMLAGLGQGIALYWRRPNPVAVAAVTAVGSLVVQLLAPYALFPYAGMIAMWALTTTRPARISLVMLAALLGITALHRTLEPESPTAGEDTGFALAVVVATWALAEATRSRRAAIRHAAEQAAESEQARLARELHDVIAHSVSVIVVQAAAGDDVFEHDPPAARQALRSIEVAGREALAELRRMLAAIGPADPTDPAAGRRPQPGLDRLDDLAEPLRAVGLVVDITREDEGAVAVPIGVQLSAYRIVQEALTNALRHAQARRIDVLVGTTTGGLTVTVTDDGRNTLPDSEINDGRGICGMRERAALLGGTLEAGRRSGGGFQVSARLPLR